MTKELIYKEIEPAVAARGCFITDVEVNPDYDITISIESEQGSVDMDDCVAVNDKFLETFDRDEEDYSLTVTSAGLDQPFRILKQYLKAVGSAVTVQVRDGRKIVGTLTGADGDGFTLAYDAKEAVPGKKKKEIVRREERFAFGAVNTVTPHIDFK